MHDEGFYDMDQDVVAERDPVDAGLAATDLARGNSNLVGICRARNSRQGNDYEERLYGSAP